MSNPMTTTSTDDSIRQLRNEAATAGDHAQVLICDIATGAVELSEDVTIDSLRISAFLSPSDKRRIAAMSARECREVCARAVANPTRSTDDDTAIDHAADPTQGQFSRYAGMYNYFNRALFAGELSPVLLNFSRKSGTYGFFAPERWTSGKVRVHEISLNPEHLGRSAMAVAATLVHEMVHAWQSEHGTPGRGGYHNAEWGAKMRIVGLVPSSTGQPGGKATGDRVSHYIETGGAFERAFVAMPPELFLPWASFVESTKSKGRGSSKVKYTCEGCDSNVWGRPGLNVRCDDCDRTFEPGAATD